MKFMHCQAVKLVPSGSSARTTSFDLNSISLPVRGATKVFTWSFSLRP